MTTDSNSSNGETVLAADGIQMSFGALRVLRGINFSVRGDGLVGVIGPNGAGKTTFFSILVGALRPDAGKVNFKQRDVTPIPMAERCRQGLVRTHQIPRPFNGMTVFENVLVAASNMRGVNRKAAYQNAIEALTHTAMLDRANRRAGALGLLDRKRLELSRALATHPQVLLLDEIGGGLSEGESQELAAMITALHERGIAIVWIEHVVALLAQVAKRFVCLDNGTLIADGTPAEVMSDDKVIEAYLGGSARR